MNEGKEKELRFLVPPEQEPVSSETYQESLSTLESTIQCDPSVVEEIQTGEAKIEGYDCAGQWTQCISRIQSPPYQMNIQFASNAQHGHRLAQKCRDDVIDTTWFDRPVLICAPYVLCSAQF